MFKTLRKHVTGVRKVKKQGLRRYEIFRNQPSNIMNLNIISNFMVSKLDI
jgi:hypothetical protein